MEARLIDDLLDLTRIDKGKVQLNFEVVDAHTLLQSALEICHAEIDRKDLTCTLDLGAQNVHLRADPARLQQIFWNLINNAVKFTPREGKISISTSNDAGGRLVKSCVPPLNDGRVPRVSGRRIPLLAFAASAPGGARHLGHLVRGRRGGARGYPAPRHPRPNVRDRFSASC